MTEINKVFDLKNINDPMKKKLYEHYKKQFQFHTQNLSEAFAEVIAQKDVLALCYWIDTFSALAKHAMKELGIDDDENSESTWTSPVIGKC